MPKLPLNVPQKLLRSCCARLERHHRNHPRNGPSGHLQAEILLGKSGEFDFRVALKKFGSCQKLHFSCKTVAKA